MNKRDKLLQYKQIQNGLPRYDLAVKQTASGYQKSDNFNIGIPSIQQGQDMSNEASMYKPSLQGAVSTSTPYTTLLKQPLTGAFKYSSIMGGLGQKAAQAATDATAKAAVANMSKISTQQALSAAANGTLTSSIYNGAAQAGKEASKKVVEQGAKEAKSALGGTLGTAASVAGALYGL